MRNEKLRLMRAEGGFERDDLRPERAGLRPDREGLRPVRADLRSLKPNLRPEGED